MMKKLYYEQKKREGYKYEISYPREADHRILIRPEHVTRDLPGVDFIYVPMEEFKWLFRTLDDYAQFLRYYTERKDGGLLHG